MTYSKLQLERKNNGLCIKCGQKRSKSTVHCLSCAIQHKKRSAELRVYRKKNNLCHACGINIPEGSTRCSKCKIAGSEQVKRLIKRRQSKGLCRCGNKATIGKVCKICWFKRISSFNTGTKKNWKELKEKLENQKSRCVYTQEILIPGINASIDHIIPKIKGGTNHLDNLQWVEKYINTRLKFNLTHDEFIILLKKIIKNTIQSLGVSQEAQAI